MKLLGGTDDGGGRGPPARSQDDAAVGYVFQRHSHEPEFHQFKQPRWASGDDAIIDMGFAVIPNQDKWKYNGPMNSSHSGGGVSLPPPPPHSSKPHQIMGHVSHQLQQQLNSHLQQQQQQQNHMNNTSQILNQTLNSATAGLPMQMAAIQGGIYDPVHQNMNGLPKPTEQLVYLGGQPHLGVMPPQSQYMQARNTAAITTSAAKKLWEKGGPGDMKIPSATSGPLAPLQLHGGPEHQVWRDSTWSTQGEILTPRRTFQQAQETNSTGSTGILSPRDSTGGLGVKMVEYVLGGSPTNKESPLASLEPRLRSLKFDDSDKSTDDKEKTNSPFDANGIKKEDQVNSSNGVVVNGIDDDKGFNRTPGSRQPSPAEEALTRPSGLLDPTGQVGSAYPQLPLQHMLGASDPQGVGQLNSYHHAAQLAAMNQMQGPVMNGVSGMHQVAQNFQQNQMVNQQQGPNQLDTSANLLQQQHNFDVQQLFRSQNPGLATSATAPGAPSGAPLPQHLPQFLAQQNAYAAQQATPYVINPGQEAAPYMGLIAAGMHQYYGVATAPWGVYPANLIPQQGSQPRRPLTPSQQGAENQPYQVISAFYDQSGSLMMGPRTGTPMRLVSPAPVLVPSGARAPQAPPIYPPQPQAAQQNLYSAQNGSSVGGLNTSLTARRDSFDRNTSAFSPSSLDYSSSTAARNAAAAKWPVSNYGALGTVTAASASPHGAPITPPPSGIGGLVSNRAPGAETKYRNVNQLAPVSLSTANTIFGSNSSIFSKLSGAVVRTPAAPLDRQPGRSRLLEDFRNQRFPNLQLRDLANHIVEFSQDQHGSRFIQQKLERATATEKQLVFQEILGSAYSLMTDVFGNYVIQKFFEYGTPEQKSTLAQQVKGHVLPLALQMYGCRVIQKALESIPPEQQQEIVRELDGHVLKCVKDQNGNHVVQKCIECVDPAALQFIINAFQGQVFNLSTHPYGCRVIQRILEHCTAEQTSPILAELHTNTNQLIEDQYGNYVIQHVLEHGKAEDKSVLINSVRGKVLVLSQHKFASNVVEKCVTHATRQERAHLIDEVCSYNDNALTIMMKDQYANYVVQKMIDVSEPTQRKNLMHKIKPHINSLRKYTYGKHIISKLEKFFMKTSSTVGSSLAPTSEGLGPIGPPSNGVL
ncbi:maternal protein pumilio isoform X3 [Lutzomyia longipalpis]|uniref:maternal protein pumilio isoform X3 n=1 Tax=Lutzomyia longipalpis TaxID=7200 RepID=UPI00248402A5|nr:maternal protein pumilio isoform X3 [Lutzomyia longipalpis]